MRFSLAKAGLTPEEVCRLRGVGYKGFLVGEAFMRAADPIQAMRDFIGTPEPLASRTGVHKDLWDHESRRCARERSTPAPTCSDSTFMTAVRDSSNPMRAGDIIDKIRTTGDSQSAKLVGVFVNESIKHVVRVARE
jgi:hypothetical protein